jgi:hypothetical protein
MRSTTRRPGTVAPARIGGPTNVTFDQAMMLVTSEHGDLSGGLPRPIADVLADADKARDARERERDEARARMPSTSGPERVGRVIADLGIDPEARGVAPIQGRDERGRLISAS